MSIKHNLTYLILLATLLQGKSSAQILEPVKWEFDTARIGHSEYLLKFKAKIEPNWHLYSQDIPQQPPATLFSFQNVPGIEWKSDVTEPEAIETFDPNFNIPVKYFEKEVTFTRKIHLTTDDHVTLEGNVEFMCCNDKSCIPPATLEFRFNFNSPVSEDSLSENPTGGSSVNQGFGMDQTKSLWGFFFLSFLFGLAAILTPCVFPMIPMTVSYFLKEEKRSGRVQAAIYGTSIVGIYVILGIILAMFMGPGFANFLSTHWLPNILFFVIFLIFALSFFGMFELTLPGWMINKSDRQADRGGWVGPVFMALTLVLVSFSCTGPIVGMILVQSAGGLILKPIIGMLGFSLAFALPFTLFAFFPSWLKKLPKSGGWMNSVKIVLGFIELALGLKFLSIADQTYHWGILDREVYLALWIVIFTLLGFYFLRKIKFVNDDETSRVTAPRLILAIITFGFVVYMIPGMVGAPLKAIAGYLPPQSTHDFDIREMIRENRFSQGISNNNHPDINRICEEPRYADFLHLPHGLTGYFDYEQALACARAQNKPLFVDFTGHGCVNCREMEASVWSHPEVQDRLRKHFIIVALYVDDKTRIPESDWIVSSYDGKTKKTIGAKNADFQISRFGVNAQPYYVLLDHQENMLCNPMAYDPEPQHFIDFLDKGLQVFQQKKTEQDQYNSY